MPIDLKNSGWLIFALLSAFFAALTTILAKVGVQGVGSNLATAIRTMVILVIAWGFAIATGEADLTKLTQRTALFLVLSGIATGLSWLFYFRALQLGQVSQVAPIDKSSLALVIVLSVLFLGEQLTMKTVVGAVLVVAGTLVIAL
jgi:transporter family protein